PPAARRVGNRPEAPSWVGDGHRAVDRADGMPRPAKPARQTFRSYRVTVRRRVPRGTPAAEGLNVCRAGLAGRGTACARSKGATRCVRFRPETGSRVGLVVGPAAV